MTMREPLGVIGAITPFNFPLNLTLHKLAPALAGGNAVVHKPAERTPLSALRLAELVNRAGAPKGAYNVITGDGPALAQAMLRNPAIAMITFTGSVEVGTGLRAQAGLKRMTSSLVIIPPPLSSPMPISIPPSSARCKERSAIAARFASRCNAFSCTNRSKTNIWTALLLQRGNYN